MVILGAVIGPILFAICAAAMPGRSLLGDEHTEAKRLLSAYQSKLPPPELLTIAAFRKDGLECGYESKKIFPDAGAQFLISGKQRKFTDYAGYVVLDNWRNSSRVAEWISALTYQIEDDMSRFKIGFLRRCIEYTAISKACMSRVGVYSDKVARFKHGREPWPLDGFGVEDQIVCTYVDGVAAKHGLTPVKRREDY
ncbi:hypothetical protein TQ38_026700 (plasmid) [Novosphingobium sp. P6W]|nr:hypothetical protein TQ38_026700 [Novosphingobium sp. P6W]